MPLQRPGTCSRSWKLPLQRPGTCSWSQNMLLQRPETCARSQNLPLQRPGTYLPKPESAPAEPRNRLLNLNLQGDAPGETA